MRDFKVFGRTGSLVLLLVSCQLQNYSQTNIFPDDGNMGVGTTTPGARISAAWGSSYGYLLNGANGVGDMFGLDGVNGRNVTINSFTPVSGALSTRIGVNYTVNGDYGGTDYAIKGNKYAPCIQLNAENGSISFFGENGTGSDWRSPSLNIGLMVHKDGTTSIGSENADSKLQIKGAGNSSSSSSFHAVNNSGSSLFYVRDDGNVGIGTATPKAKLAVNGDIFSTKVKVTQSGWPDYVFHHNYDLLPLSSLEKFIQMNKHLPEIPSASQIEKNGLDVGENQAALLKKIEELTLYIIDLNKRLEKFENHAKLKDK